MVLSFKTMEMYQQQRNLEIKKKIIKTNEMK